jgi:hypothetical protein
MAQFLALPLSIMFHDDCTTALYQLNAKYDPRVVKDFPNATRTSWTGTLFLRFFVGFSLIFISFIQIIQASRITDLFLNLEAIVFVGNIDNYAFWLAEKNFLNREFCDACKEVKNITFPASQGGKITRIRRIALLFVYVVLVMCWAAIVVRQNGGVYLKNAACNSFSVFFGDQTLDLVTDRIRISAQGTSRENSELFDSNETEVELVYSSFSGTYMIGEEDNGKLEILDDRAVYYEVVSGKNIATQGKGSRGKFFYCEGAWLFTIEMLSHAFDREGDEDEGYCGRWLLRSPATEAFTLENVSPDGWKIWTGDIEEAEDFSFSCDDCEKSVDCNYHGTCLDKKCVCGGNRLGNSCEIEPPCASMELVQIGESAEHFKFLERYSLLDKSGHITESRTKDDLVLMYDRPVYKSHNSSDYGSGSSYSYVYYLGSRWNVAHWPESDIQDALQGGGAHAFWGSLFKDSGLAISEMTKSGLPLGLHWQLPLDSKSRGDFGPYLALYPWKLTFQCIENSCKGRNLCGDFGKCIDGACVCNNCFGGYFCEYPNYGDYAGTQYFEWLLTGTGNGTYYDRYWSQIDDPETCWRSYMDSVA